MSPLGAQIPAEFAAFPQLITAIIEVEQIFDDPDLNLVAGSSTLGGLATSGTGVLIFRSGNQGAPGITFHSNGGITAGTTVLPGLQSGLGQLVIHSSAQMGRSDMEAFDSMTMRRARSRPPYTSFTDRLAHCRRVSVNWLGSAAHISDEDHKARDYYLSAIMRGHITIEHDQTR